MYEHMFRGKHLEEICGFYCDVLLPAGGLDLSQPSSRGINARENIPEDTSVYRQ
jgi:hypothetical protein